MKPKFIQNAIICISILISSSTLAQQTNQWQLEKMPADLETQYALSALPPHLRDSATVYLLDPAKGYYMARQGANGFTAFIIRTEWERAEFVPDMYSPLAFDAEGSKTLQPLYMDVAALRASGKFTPAQLRDTMVQRIMSGKYKAPARPGISYMLSPLLRGHVDGQGIVNMVMPHYMFYAPGIDNSDVGGKWVTGGHQPFVVTSGKVLDKAHSISNFIIIAAGETEKATIVQEQKDLLEKLAKYKAVLKVDVDMAAEMHH